MNDEIKIGLDFGTHQTKICVRRTPDEGRGEPNYEFFKFTDLQGNNQYFLPSVIQINDDDTLSYGYVNSSRMKAEPDEPIKQTVLLEEEFDVAEKAGQLYDKYATAESKPEDMYVLSEMLKIRLQKVKARNARKTEEAEKEYYKLLHDYKDAKNVFRYFKQATFIGGEWNRVTTISNRTLCTWYLAYVIFLLEEKFGTDFSINMGVPADEESFEAKKRLAVEILATAYYLVEEVYKSDLTLFLNEKYEDLLAKTENQRFSDELKDEYVINIFPEAYASLTALTSRGKLPTGMSLTADIGGGTTDISFFTIEDGLPMIYKYWSIPRGLNYVAARSGFDYADGDFTNRVHQEVIDKFNRKKYELVSNLVKDLAKKIQNETSIPVQNLRDALKDRILVYSGGGSTFDFLTKPIDTFTDIRIIDASIWNEENIKDKADVANLSLLLTTAYGLSVSVSDEDVKLKSYHSLFAHLPKKHENTIEEISKDQC
jgi:hypothetical protein